MQVRIEDVSPVEKKLIVEVPWNTVNDKLGDAYRELSKNVRLKGFRKGKVPRSVLQRMYGKHVKAEVAGQLIRESFITATSEHNLQAVSEPKLETPPDIRKGEPFAFEAIVEVKGEVDPKDYSGLEITRRPLAVADDDVDKALDNLRREHTELLPIEGRDVTARTDVVTISLQGTVGDEELDRPQLNVDLGEPGLSFLPGLAEALIGLPINVEDHEIELAIPENHIHRPFAGQTAKLTISIRDARKKELPDLDDEFAQDIERGESVAELRQSVREDLEKQQQAAIDQEVREAAIKALVERNPIPVASTLVERGIMYRLQQLQSLMGMPLGNAEGLDFPEEIREKLRPETLAEIRGQLLLEAIADKEGLEVSDEDVDAHLAKVAEARDQPVARVRAELSRDGQLESLQHQLRHDKIIDLLVAQAKITEAEPEPEPAPDADATTSAPASEPLVVGSETAAKASDDPAPGEPDGGEPDESAPQSPESQ